MFEREYFEGQSVSVMRKGERVTGKIRGSGPTRTGRIYLVVIDGTGENISYYRNEINN